MLSVWVLKAEFEKLNLKAEKLTVPTNIVFFLSSIIQNNCIEVA